MKNLLNRLIGIFKYKKLILTLLIVGLIIVSINIVSTQADTNKPSTDTKEVAGIATSIPEATITPKPAFTSSPKSSSNPSSSSSPTSAPLSSNTPTTSPTATPSPTSTATTSPTATSAPTQSPSPTPAPVAPAASNTKVLNILFVPYGVNPVYNPYNLTSSLVNGIKESSHNKLNYQIVETQEPQRSTSKKSDGRMDYNAILTEFDICNRLNSGEIDEVWIWVNGGDGAGFEYTASGPTMNDPYSGMNSCGKNMFVMGFDYTRTWDLALHSMGHRMEFAAKNRHYSDYITWDTRDHRYSSPYNTDIPLENGVTGCGNVHFPPTATKHYDYSNMSLVQSNCSGTTETITCTAWGCTQEGFLKWWFGYVPSPWWDAFLGK